MAERAGDAEPRDVVVRIDGGLQADDRVHLEQRDRRGRALEIDLLEDAGGQRVGVHFQPDLERRRRIDALLDDLVHAELVGPELFVTEGLEAEDALALGELRGRRLLAGSRLRGRGLSLGGRLRAARAGDDSKAQHNQGRRRTNCGVCSHFALAPFRRKPVPTPSMTRRCAAFPGSEGKATDEWAVREGGDASGVPPLMAQGVRLIAAGSLTGSRTATGSPTDPGRAAARRSRAGRPRPPIRPSRAWRRSSARPS